MMTVTAITVAALLVVAGGALMLVLAMCAMSGRGERQYEAEMFRRWENV